MGLAVLKTMSDAVRSAPGSDATRIFDAVLLTAAVGLLADLVLYALILLMPPQPEEVLVRPFFYRMDAPLLLIAVASLFAIRFLQPPAPLAAALDPAWRHPGWIVSLAMAVVLALGVAGASIVTLGVHLSRDEQMAASDAMMLAHGNLMNPIPVEWRPYADALQFLFVQFSDGATHWVSAYFPVNAWVRSVFMALGDPDAASPVVAALAVWLAFDVARTLWPDRRDAAIVAAVLVAASPQVLVTAMTPYAMTLHLTLTLLWLRFWLRNDLLGHVGAIATGALATGIHQIAVHALFVAPFIAALWVARSYRLALVYTVAYGAIGLGWLSYWKFAAAFMGATLPVAPGGGFADLVAKILPVLQDLSIAGFLYVPLFVLKFVAWQHILFLPLLLAAFSAWREMPSTLRLSLLAAGLTLAVVFVIMPYQGHGWGYRYLHGFIGPLALACAYGWVVLTTDAASGSSLRLRFALAATTTVTLLVSLPVLAAELRRYHAPYAAAEAHLRAQPVDVVVIDHLGSRAGSLVSNAADLSNKPKIMALSGLDDAQLRSLCARYSVAFFGIDHMRAFGLDAFERSIRPGIMRTLDHRRQVLRDAGCTAEVPFPAAGP